MSKLDQLLNRGAVCCAGDIILRNVVMGRMRNGDFQITPEGIAELEIEDVVAVEVVEQKPKKRAKAEPVAEPVVVEDPNPLESLGE